MINLAVAERVIRTQPAPPTRMASAVVSQQMVEEHPYVDQGHKQGNVVITVAHNHNP